MSFSRAPPDSYGSTDKPQAVDELAIAASQWAYAGIYAERHAMALLFTAVDALRSKTTGGAMEVSKLAPPSFLERMIGHNLIEDMSRFSLPADSVIEHLIGLYFKSLNAPIPLLIESVFVDAWHSGIANRDPNFRALVFAIMARASQLTDQPECLTWPTWMGSQPESMSNPDPMARGYSFFFAALQLVLRPGPSTVHTLQAWTLLCEAALQTGSVVMAYTLVGWAARCFIETGCHRNNLGVWTKSYVGDQLRKRAFWHFFSIDRMLGLMMGRPFAISEADVDLDLPEDRSDASILQMSSMNLPLAKTLPNLRHEAGDLLALQQLARLARLGTAINSTILYSRGNRPLTSGGSKDVNVAALRNLLKTWLSAVPHELFWNPENLDQAALARSGVVSSAYYATVLTIYRVVVWPLTDRAVKEYLPDAVQASIQISQVFAELFKRGINAHLWNWTIQSISVAGLLLLTNAYSTGAAVALDDEASQALQDLRDCLHRMRDTRWGAARCEEVLRTHTERLVRDAAASPKRRQTQHVLLPTDGLFPSGHLQAASESASSVAERGFEDQTRLFSEASQTPSDLGKAQMEPVDQFERLMARILAEDFDNHDG